MTDPAISVLMPVFNAAPFLEEAINSVLGQTFGDFEFLIVDDGSTDASLATLRRYSAVDARIKLVSRPNTGYAVALNEMIARSQGAFLARMDADDVSMPQRFERQVAFLRDNPACVAVGTGALYVDPEGSPVHEMDLLQSYVEIEACHLAFRGSALAHPSVMMRRESVIGAGGYRAEYVPAEDIDLWLRLGEIGQLRNLPETLLKYRLHAGSTSRANRNRQQEAMQAAVVAAHQRRGLPLARGVSTPCVQERAAAGSDRCEWARLAFEHGAFGNARRLAMKAVASEPASPRAWRSLAVALLGRRARLLRRWLGSLGSAPPS